MKVHPRIRGEYYNGKCCFFCASGSPPHTRGIQIAGYIPGFAPGFTPAYAGNTYRIRPEIEED